MMRTTMGLGSVLLFSLAAACAGPAGPQGPAGAAGPKGADGAAGQDGAAGTPGAPGQDGAPGANGADGQDGAPGTPGRDGGALPAAVYTMTNDPAGNGILALERGSGGLLYNLGTFSTGGLGTGNALGDQFAFAFDEVSERFFVVNAGDNTISMMQLLNSDGSLHALDVVDAGGVTPVSIAVHDGLVFVVNAGDSANNVAANIRGFRVGDYTLDAIAGADLPLSAANPAPAAIQFSPDGAHLVVTEKATSTLDVYNVDASGAVTGPNAQASAGATPFGFVFNDAGVLLVSEAFGGTANASAVSSYTVAADGTLTAVTRSLSTQQTAACWMAAVGPYTWAANAGSDNVTGYLVGADGSLSLLNSDGVSGVTGHKPLDEAVSADGAFLYVVDGGSHSLSTFAIQADGSLTRLGDIDIPATAVGVVAR